MKLINTEKPSVGQAYARVLGGRRSRKSLRPSYEYQDFDLVIAGPLGIPTESGTIKAALRLLIERNDLPRVVFHSLRHSSITYKLKLNGGDVKAVQGASGHAQVKMVTDVYSHILDDDRRNNAQLFENVFYSGAGRDPAKAEARDEAPQAPVDAAQIETTQGDAEALGAGSAAEDTDEVTVTMQH